MMSPFKIVFLAVCLRAQESRIMTMGFAQPLSSHGIASTSPMKTSLFETSNAVPSKSTDFTDSSKPQPVPSTDTTRLLDDALRFNSTAADVIMNELSGLRNASSQEAETYLDALLEYVDKSNEDIPDLPWWTCLRPIARLSRRARLASLRRVLDLSTPKSEETETICDDPDAAKRRKRRSLLILIRSLANGEDGEDGNLSVSRKSRIPVITQLEKAARRASTLTNADMINRIPPGLETPNYSILDSRPASRDRFEVRRYDPFSVCSVAMNRARPKDSSKTDAKISNPQLAGASSFGALAGYLFGKNKQQMSMKMTTPVFSEGAGDERSMSFVLPSDYWKEDELDMAPEPLLDSGVTLQSKSVEHRAVVVFGGYAGKNDVDERTTQLLNGLAKDKKWRATEDGRVTLAQYNDPFTPPWKRRNEVSVKVEPRYN